MQNKTLKIFKENIKNIPLVLILLLGIFLRLYQLDNLPMEMYGDIVEGYKFIQEIHSGKWPFYFVLGNGPLFFYFAALITKILGLTFFSMKISSVIVGELVIIATYFLGKEIFNKKVALWAAFLVAVSKWPLVFSRIGNMPITVPFFTTIIICLCFKIEKNPKKTTFWILLGALLGGGFYIYPAFFVTPMVVYFLLTQNGLKFIRNNFPKLLIFSFFFVLTVSPFIKIYIKEPTNWTGTSSYFGSKIFVSEGRLAQDWPFKFWQNIKKTNLMFITKGDPVFRSTPPYQPAIDKVSSLLLIFSILYGFFSKKFRKKTIIIFVSIYILMLPSILVLNVPSDVPSMNRTIAVFPLVFILIANGLHIIGEKLTQKVSPQLPTVFLVGVLLTILALNLKIYFKEYAYYLPNHNEGFPRLIAQIFDQLPPGTVAYMYGAHWADWGQPDPRAVRFELRGKNKFIYIAEGDLTCKIISEDSSPKFIITSPNSDENFKEIKGCLPDSQEKYFFTPKYQFPLFVEFQIN